MKTSFGGSSREKSDDVCLRILGYIRHCTKARAGCLHSGVSSICGVPGGRFKLRARERLLFPQQRVRRSLHTIRAAEKMYRETLTNWLECFQAFPPLFQSGVCVRDDLRG
jgi:hypothetical protein